MEWRPDRYVPQYPPNEVDDIKPDTPPFWSTFGQRRRGIVRRMEGKDRWNRAAPFWNHIDRTRWAVTASYQTFGRVKAPGEHRQR